METKGVASVRSPVCNLQQFEPSVSHSMFVDAVVQAFRREYYIDEDVSRLPFGFFGAYTHYVLTSSAVGASG